MAQSEPTTMMTNERQMPEDHNPDDCRICRYLAKPCPQCGKLHSSYELAANCMRTNLTAYHQYQKADGRPY